MLNGAETFFAKVFNYRFGQGQMDINAKGMINGQVRGAAFFKTGSSLSVEKLNDSFGNMVALSRIDSNCAQRELYASIVKPIQTTCVLKQVDCGFGLIQQPDAAIPQKNWDDPEYDEYDYRVIAAGSCTGDGDFFDGLSCYGAVDTGHKMAISLRVHGQGGGRGTMDVISHGDVEAKVEHVTYVKKGQSIQTSAFNQLSLGARRVSSASFCASEDQVWLRFGETKLPLKAISCSAPLLAPA